MEPAAPKEPKHVAKKMNTRKIENKTNGKNYLSVSDWRRNSFSDSLNTSRDGAGRSI